MVRQKSSSPFYERVAPFCWVSLGLRKEGGVYLLPARAEDL
jgi:hypothetical protein